MVIKILDTEIRLGKVQDVKYGRYGKKSIRGVKCLG